MLTKVKDAVVGATSDLFSHGPRPLERTMCYPGDPGLLGPESVSWSVIGDAAAFVGGIRALIVQSAHPEVAAGVAHHSRYQADPLGRLSRTSAYVTETTYGAMPEVEAAVAAVRHAHRPVRGRSDRGKPYSAGHPAMAAWVHNVLTDSFLAAYQAYGPRPLSAEDADRFVAEQTRVGGLLGADPMPTTADDLAHWVAAHPDLDPSGAQEQAIDFLGSPPLPLVVRPAYRPLFSAATATVPAPVSGLVGLTPTATGRRVGQATVRGLRWTLGSSPSWHLALVRSGAPVPEGHFRQPLPAAADGSGRAGDRAGQPSSSPRPSSAGRSSVMR